MRVLQIAAEGASLELDGDLDEDGQVRDFYRWIGGPTGFEDPDEEPAPRVSHGPFSWQTVLERWLRPSRWLARYPCLVHPAIVPLVRAELPGASGECLERWSAIVQSTAFRADILRAYDRPHGIHPFIGDAFASAEPGVLRVMTIGLNAYLSEADWDQQHPNWFSGWHRTSRHRFNRAVAADASVIGGALTGEGSPFADLFYRHKDGVFHTNAVKEYLPESRGKHSDQLTRQDFEDSLPTWHAELDIMARHGVLPHVILVFGRPFWERAWQAFHPRTRPSFAHLQVHSFENALHEGHHFANLMDVEGTAGRHKLALLGLRHPASYATSKATPDWLLSRPDVRALLGLATT